MTLSTHTAMLYVLDRIKGIIEILFILIEITLEIISIMLVHKVAQDKPYNHLLPSFLYLLPSFGCYAPTSFWYKRSQSCYSGGVHCVDIDIT